MIPYVINERSLTFYVDGQSYNVTSDHPNFPHITEFLVNGVDIHPQDLINLSSVQRTLISKFSEAEDQNYLPSGLVSVEHGEVYYNGELVDSTLTNKIVAMLREDYDVLPWILFMENLYRNPNRSTMEELYDWMRSCALPLTTDGHFLAFKKVRDDYKDFHTGTMDNSVGNWVEMPDRFHVDPVRTNHCSYGLHFCSPEYLKAFHSNNGRVVVVKIDPADVVSIPNDYNFTKGRCWKYLVVGEISEEEAHTRTWPVVSDWTTPVRPLTV